MVEYYTVNVAMNFVLSHTKDTIQFDFHSREDAEDFALAVDLHRHLTTRDSKIGEIENELQAYFSPEGEVILRKHTTEKIVGYEGIKES